MSFKRRHLHYTPVVTIVVNSRECHLKLDVPIILFPKIFILLGQIRFIIFRIRWPADEKQTRVRILLALLVRVHRCLEKKSFKTETVIINLTLVARVTLTHLMSALVMGPIEMLYKRSL
jgi:hypothetical protein